MIENFVNENTINNSEKGYVFTNMMQAADYLKEIDHKKLESEELYLKLLIEKK